MQSYSHQSGCPRPAGLRGCCNCSASTKTVNELGDLKLRWRSLMQWLQYFNFCTELHCIGETTSLFLHMVNLCRNYSHSHLTEYATTHAYLLFHIPVSPCHKKVDRFKSITRLTKNEQLFSVANLTRILSWPLDTFFHLFLANKSVQGPLKNQRNLLMIFWSNK